MGARPVTAIWGIGPRTADHLAEMGIHTVVDLATCDHQELARRFGPRIGPSLKVLGLGGDDARVVDEPYVPRGRSREVTFEHDITSRAEIEEHVTRLAIEVTESVVAEGRSVTHVAVKIRTASFFTRTKIGKLVRATTDAADVVRHALVVLDRFDLDRPVRLLGVRVVLDVPVLRWPGTDRPAHRRANRHAPGRTVERTLRHLVFGRTVVVGGREECGRLLDLDEDDGLDPVRLEAAPSSKKRARPSYTGPCRCTVAAPLNRYPEDRVDHIDLDHPVPGLDVTARGEVQVSEDQMLVVPHGPWPADIRHCRRTGRCAILSG